MLGSGKRLQKPSVGLFFFQKKIVVTRNSDFKSTTLNTLAQNLAIHEEKGIFN